MLWLYISILVVSSASNLYPLHSDIGRPVRGLLLTAIVRVVGLTAFAVVINLTIVSVRSGHMALAA